MDHLTKISVVNTLGATIASYDYTLDPIGMVMQVKELGGRTVNYTYDNMPRLLTERISMPGDTDKVFTFIYDKVGNRLSHTRPDGETISYSYDNNDRLLTEVSNTNGNTGYAYNNNGALISKISPSENTTLTYDPEERLIGAQITKGGVTKQANYAYDYNGNRVRGTLSDGADTDVITYLVDPSFQFAQVLEEQDENNALVAAYTYGNDLIAQERSGAFGYYHHDSIGSARMLTAADGSPLNDYIYEAYGSLITQNGSVPNNYLYAGEQNIPETGLYYLRARYYDPILGRFISSDPFSGFAVNPISLHKYIYTLDNPINFTDPTGESAWLMILGLVFGIWSYESTTANTIGIGLSLYSGYSLWGGADYREEQHKDRIRAIKVLNDFSNELVKKENLDKAGFDPNDLKNWMQRAISNITWEVWLSSINDGYIGMGWSSHIPAPWLFELYKAGKLGEPATIPQDLWKLLDWMDNILDNLMAQENIQSEIKNLFIDTRGIFYSIYGDYENSHTYSFFDYYPAREIKKEKVKSYKY